MTGSSIDAEDTLSLQQIRPMIETVPLANAAEAYGRMMRNEARFKIVLVSGLTRKTAAGRYMGLVTVFWPAMTTGAGRFFSGAGPCSTIDVRRQNVH